jgi:DNA-binding PadR family transcriptional regulator
MAANAGSTTAPRDDRDPGVPPSLTEYVVLAVLGEGPAHGFAIARELSAGGEIGRVWTVRRPLVYRALDRLVAGGLATPHGTEPGDAGPRRTVLRLTGTGRDVLDGWLERPVTHIRDLRVAFLLKLVFLRRAGRSVRPLAAAQREALAPTLAALQRGSEDDEIGMWRRHNAAAVAAFLDELLTGT